MKVELQNCLKCANYDTLNNYSDRLQNFEDMARYQGKIVTEGLISCPGYGTKSMDSRPCLADVVLPNCKDLDCGIGLGTPTLSPQPAVVLKEEKLIGIDGFTVMSEHISSDSFIG